MGTEKKGSRFILVLAVLFLCAFSQKTKAQEQLRFDEQGNLFMTTHDRIATSNRTYKTVGWTIKRYNQPIHTPGNDHVVVVLEDNGAPQPDPDNPAYQYCYFRVDKQTLFDRIGAVSYEWQQDLYTNGGTLYLDAYMTVCLNGVPQGGLADGGNRAWGYVYDTFEGISTAQNWADPQALRSHFDKQVYFGGNPLLLNPPCSYSVRHLECFDEPGKVWNLSRYGKDVYGQLRFGEARDVYAENFSAYEFDYVSVNVILQYANGSSENLWFEISPVHVEHFGNGLVSVQINFYYKRRGNVAYLTDKYNMNGEQMLVGGKLSIGAGNKEEQNFDVKYGVPSGENLYVEGEMNKFGYCVRYANLYGYSTRAVTVISRYTMQWSDENGVPCTRMVEQAEVYYVDKPYSYWSIEQLELFTLDSVRVYNYAFDKESVVLKDVYEPVVEVEQKSVHRREEPQTVTIDCGVLYGQGRQPDFPYGIQQAKAAELAEDCKVCNDSFRIDSEVFLSGMETDSSASAPKIGSDSGRQPLYKENLMIPKEKKNGLDYKSCAEVIYQQYSTNSEVTYGFLNVNGVTVHTPVVCVCFAEDEKPFNQLCKPDKDRKSWILGRSYELKLSSEGLHRNIKGYQYQDYSRYVSAYQMQFPFEVYYNGYRAANTWMDYVEGQKFYVPTGVKEGNYMVMTRALAYNFDEDEEGNVEFYSNDEISNYGACHSIEVQVCGRLYGLAVTGIASESWESVFADGGAQNSVSADEGAGNGISYTIGLHNLNGELVRTQSEKTVPILMGGNPLEPEHEGEVLGTKFFYQLQSIGNYGEEDGVCIVPEYYVTDRNGGNRMRVELYRFQEETDGRKHAWKKISPKPEDAGEPVPEIEGCIWLSGQQRETIGDESRNVADLDAAKSSVQRWSGELEIPADSFIVPYGTDVEKYVKEHGSISMRDKLFVRTGYLLVRFSIYTVKDGKTHLSYINEDNAKNGYANMWKIEGFANPKLRPDGSGFALEYGDVFLYDLEKRPEPEFDVVGTH